MGAAQSGSKPSTELATPKTCYYELLGVEPDASDDDIKKAYRRRALELHPDRNFGDAEAATRKFAELQSAYEILSDPHERSWYDSHRDVILGGQDMTDNDVETASFRNIRMTSAEEIMSLVRKFNASIPFNDDATGFFTITRETFERLALEEEAAAELDKLVVFDYPSFGQAQDDEVVRPFYTAWSGFATQKTFAWKDKYRLSDAPDRRLRRLMEKENKKLRETAAREFNDTVRFLVRFVRKRDPRCDLNAQTEAQRHETSREAAAAQATRSRTANQARLAEYQLPDWVVSQGNSLDEEGFLISDETEPEVVEVLECVVCEKTFKSEKQLEAHERSKKHVKSVQKLRWQMRKEGVELQLSEDSADCADQLQTQHNIGISTTIDAQETEAAQSSPLMPEDTGLDADSLASSASTGDETHTPITMVGDETTTTYRGDPKTCTSADEQAAAALSASASSLSIAAGTDTPKKIGKAKAKREKKAAAALAAGHLKHQQHRCTVCEREFDSRTKLFAHIRVEGHAVAPRLGRDSSGRG